MALPQAAKARLFYRAAKLRHDDAQLLMRAERTNGAVYLAGYTVECYLKALLLNSVSPQTRSVLLDSFRGAIAHDIRWLTSLYLRYVHMVIPKEIRLHLLRVGTWSTDLRYQTGTLPRSDAVEFMASVVTIAQWADGRM
jgi:hypothetical protein